MLSLISDGLSNSALGPLVKMGDGGVFSELEARDGKILKAVRELAQSLNITDVQPEKIEWIDYVYIRTGRERTTITVRADYPGIEKKRLVLPERLEKALTPEQWTPLIASSLIVRAWAIPRRKKLLSTWIIVALGIYALIAAFTIPDEVSQGKITIWIQVPVAIAVFFGSLGVLIPLFAPALHQEVLSADKQAAGLIGTEVFLDTLLKLKELGEETSSATRKLARYRQATISERIENLHNS